MNDPRKWPEWAPGSGYMNQKTFETNLYEIPLVPEVVQLSFKIDVGWSHWVIWQKSMDFADFGQNYPGNDPTDPVGSGYMNQKTIEMVRYDKSKIAVS